MTETPSDERDFWDRRADAWERRADSLNAFSDAYGVAAMDALHVEPGDRVLDVGCGPGTTAIELAERVGPGGVVVGVDISPAMVAAATRRAAAAGVTNVRFVVADAQTETMVQGFDAAYSRFGVMFFSDPVAAFANIGGALRPGGRLACVVWGPLTDNPWMFVPTLAAGPVLQAELTFPGANEPGPFSLADRTRVMAVVGEAGFVDITVDPLASSRLITTATADDDVRTLLEVGPLGEAYDKADETTRRAAVDAVVAAIEPFRADDGWLLPGSALKIAAQHP
ncbi:MAG: UbiE/COQ5 family methyltransferase [Acidimicrobiales bacterium]|nr:UbiE/COQ5 family methyltransferase [Acidimicrobiales bacterium]